MLCGERRQKRWKVELDAGVITYALDKDYAFIITIPGALNGLLYMNYQSFAKSYLVGIDSNLYLESVC